MLQAYYLYNFLFKACSQTSNKIKDFILCDESRQFFFAEEKAWFLP
jgi:hypothetical protein